MSPNRLNLDNDEIRARVRGYTPRPLPKSVARPAVYKKVVFDINCKQVPKLNLTKKTSPISDIKAPISPKILAKQPAFTNPVQSAVIRPQNVVLPPSEDSSEESPIESVKPAEFASEPFRVQEEDDQPDQSQKTDEQYQEIPTLPIPKKKPMIAKAGKLLSQVNSAYLISVLAILFIVGGALLGVSGFKANQKIESQAKALAADYRGAENYPENNGSFDETPVSKEAKQDYVVADDLPKLIKIPSIRVNARVKRITVNSSNMLELPKNVFDAGWYDGSAKPGENGVTLIDGHVSGPTQHGVFFYLNRVKVDDRIDIERGDGKIISYKIVSAELYDADKVDMKKVLEPIVKSRRGLNIMTWAGKYIAENQQYDKRLVVYAVEQ